MAIGGVYNAGQVSDIYSVDTKCTIKETYEEFIDILMTMNRAINGEEVTFPMFPNSPVTGDDTRLPMFANFSLDSVQQRMELMLKVEQYNREMDKMLQQAV
ncbi:hypothetical protein ACFL4J_01875 [Candidatus Margulisiibacteriota bacterium]